MTQVGRIELRREDEVECLRGGFPSGEAALRHSIEHSTRAYQVTSPEGEVLCYWGLREQSPFGGCVAWMLSTPAIEVHRVFAARQSVKMLGHLLDTYGDVTVAVDRNYTASVEWLRWLGFTFLEDLDANFIRMRAVRRGAMH